MVNMIKGGCENEPFDLLFKKKKKKNKHKKSNLSLDKNLKWGGNIIMN